MRSLSCEVFLSILLLRYVTWSLVFTSSWATLLLTGAICCLTYFFVAHPEAVNTRAIVPVISHMEFCSDLIIYPPYPHSRVRPLPDRNDEVMWTEACNLPTPATARCRRTKIDAGMEWRLQDLGILYVQ